MKTNEAGWDRIARVVAGVLLLYVGLAGAATGAWALAADVVGAVLLLTGVTGFCPLYALLKIRTNKA